jgi:coniferyl-aldehyde dehydrogenase
MYPTLLQNTEYTSVVNGRHYQRLNHYLEEAVNRGQRVVTLNPGNEDFTAQSGSFKIPPTLIVNPEDDLALMQEEIFGPLLPILTYSTFDETIHYINNRPRPLAAYYFGRDAAEEEAVIQRTTSGGVCVNDVLMHILQEDLPFGGIGPSGMGSYHGLEGFKTFSHAKSVYRQTSINVAKLGGMLPPYSSKTENTIKTQLKR